ncbi:hypothetical protein [Hymenobacter glacieicola]|uniref:Uncharacterized protein n=1 Tax=Hymenobacter glacieicola TaxID=1562124 RepID=A0ABQ1WKJ9_9BACT|nr:hypothetical protein [Hymenobacter glacieicola]GGG34093.1 hypothetical protein GCM10011378_08140 [Hymenobacter glacieicola]
MKIEDIDKAVAFRADLIKAENLLNEVKKVSVLGGRGYIRIAAGTGASVDVDAADISAGTWRRVVDAICTDLNEEINSCATAIDKL